MFVLHRFHYKRSKCLSSVKHLKILAIQCRRLKVYIKLRLAEGFMLILQVHLVDSIAVFEVSFLFKYLFSSIDKNLVWSPLKGAVRCLPACPPIWSDISLVPPAASCPASHSVLTRTTCLTALDHKGKRSVSWDL